MFIGILPMTLTHENSPIKNLKRKHSSDDEIDQTYEKQVKIKEDPDSIQVKEEPGKSCDTKNENSQPNDTKSVTVKKEIEDKPSTDHHERLRMSLESDSDDEQSNAERYKI